MSDDKYITIALPKDNSRAINKSTKESLYQFLHGEVFNPKDSRTHVLTFHLYVEFWMDKLLAKLGISKSKSFFEKFKILKDNNVFENNLAQNIHILNRLRNLFCHELDLEKVENKVTELISSMYEDPYIRIEDDFYLRKICAQTLILLEATYNNECRPPKLDIFPHEEIKNDLLNNKKISWSDCEIISMHDEGRNITRWDITCPNCNKEIVSRYKDNTVGAKESWASKCKACGLEGDGSYFHLK